MNEETFETITVQSEGVTLSKIVWRRFRKPMPGLFERTLDLNPGLADLGIFLPVGTVLTLPIPTPRVAPEVTPIRLWN
jgi:phage tail protein X